jgi:hypothetical protein
MTLSRLVAAEKNGVAAIEISKLARKGENELRQRVQQLEAENAAMKTAIDQLRQQMFAMLKIGSGPTSRN